jgi:hypothetical protein
MSTHSRFKPNIDLFEIRRQLIAIRCQHSQDKSVTRPINKLLSKLSSLREPRNRAHEKLLMKSVAKALLAVSSLRQDDSSVES